MDEGGDGDGELRGEAFVEACKAALKRRDVGGMVESKEAEATAEEEVCRGGGGDLCCRCT